MVGSVGNGGLFAGLDLGLALLTLEPVVLVAKTLVLLPQYAVFGDHFFNQVQQVDDGLTSAFYVLYIIRIELVEHSLCPIMCVDRLYLD